MGTPKQSTTTIKTNATIISRGNFPSLSIVVQSGYFTLFCCSLNLSIYDIVIANFQIINNETIKSRIHFYNSYLHVFKDKTDYK